MGHKPRYCKVEQILDELTQETKKKKPTTNKIQKGIKKKKETKAQKGTTKAWIDTDQVGQAPARMLCGGEDKVLGTKLEQWHERSQVRIFFQNTRGVLKIDKLNNDKRDGLLDEAVLHQLQELDVDIVCLTETNINWNNT